MKRLIFVLSVLIFVYSGPAQADYLGVKKASEFISFFLINPFDSAYGIERIPDSAHVLTYADNGTSTTFTARSTVYPFSAIGIDTVKNFGDTAYLFVDQIQDIDGAGGNFLLAIDVTLFAGIYPTHTHAIVQVVTDSLNIALEGADNALKPTTLGRTLDVALTGESGVDLNNVLGTLDAPEIGVAAITSAQIATDAIGALELSATAVAEIEDSVHAQFADYRALTDSANIKTMLSNNPSIASGDALKPATIGRVLDVDVFNRAFVDVKAISADDFAADSLEAWLDGYSNTQLTNREQLFTNLDVIVSSRASSADLDSLTWTSGLMATANSIARKYNDLDTLFLKIGVDTVRARIYYHTGGTPGAAPDSTKTVNW